MARPKMRFEPATAIEVISDLRSKLDDYKFCDGILVKEQGASHPSIHAARTALAPLYELVDKSHRWLPNFEPFPEEGCERLRLWLEAYVTPKGWQRIQATLRQRKASQKKGSGRFAEREMTVAMLAGPSYALGEMAMELGINKKELLSRLPAWFLDDQNGRVAFEAFGTTVRIEQSAQGLKLLEDVFQLSTNQVKRILFKALGRDPLGERELLRFAYFAGKPRLTRLAKVLKTLPAQEQLHILVTVKHQDKRLLELAGAGAMSSVLEALGVAGAEVALAANVAAIEEALQSEAVAVVADRLVAAVPETADFGKFSAPSEN